MTGKPDENIFLRVKDRYEWKFCAPPNDKPCFTAFGDIKNFDEYLINLIDQVQRHTKCSESYCVTKKNRQRKYKNVSFWVSKKCNTDNNYELWR